MIKRQSQIAMNNFLHNVVWLRKQHGLSKKQMAKILGIGIGSLNKLENGELPPRMSIRILDRIQKYFGISKADQFAKRLGSC